MTRRSIPLMACIFALATARPGLAQGTTPTDPLLGIWKLNPARTRASAGAPLTPPAQRTEVYRLSGTGDIELEVITTAGDGTTSRSTLTFSARGGVVRQPTAPAGPMLVETRLGSREWLVTYLADGVQFMTMRKVISADGRTMRQSVSGVGPGGRPWEGLLVFDRQQAAPDGRR